MVAKVLSIEGRTRPCQVNEAIVELLSDWLEAAKRGELKSVAMAGIEADGGSRTSASASDCFHETLGALVMLQYAMMKKRDED